MHIEKSHQWVFFIAFLLTVVASWPAEASLQDSDVPSQRETFQHPALQIRSNYVSAGVAQNRGVPNVAKDLASLGVPPQTAYLDMRTGRWNTLMPATPLLPGRGVGNQLTWQSLGHSAPRSLAQHQRIVWETFLTYVDSHHAALGLDVGEMPRMGKVTIHRGGELIQIHAPRFVDGHLVRDSYLTATIRSGNLVLFSAVNWDDINVHLAPSLSATVAQGIAETHMSTIGAAGRWIPVDLALVPWSTGDDLDAMVVGQGLDYRLVWSFRVRFDDGEGAYEALVDAHGGVLLSFQDLHRSASGTGSACLGPVGACDTVTAVDSLDLAVVEGSDRLLIKTGDGDLFLDNCETATLTFDVLNLGELAQTNVRIVGAVSPSHPALDPSFSPNGTIGSLDVGSKGQGSVDFAASSLAFNDTLKVLVEVTSDELSPDSRYGLFTIDAVESDWQSFSSRTFSMEIDEEGWKPQQGTFDRTGGDGSDGTFAFRSSAAQNDACDVIRSPWVVMGANTTLSLHSNFDIEPQTEGTWYDRASVGTVAADGERTLVRPDGGRLYNADSDGPGTYIGCNDPEEGWAGVQQTWAESTWSPAALGSDALSGETVQLEVIYGTDGALAHGGFWFDEITLTHVDMQVPDTQEDCLALDIFMNGFESGDTLAWSNTIP